MGGSDRQVNAFQRLSQIAVQKSIREGFGLVVSEALWKDTPVVAANTGGIPLQMADGAGGVLVQTVEECAKGIVALHRDPEHARDLACKGRERVREPFPLPRLLVNEMALMQELAAGRPIVPGEHRDPVCGMSVSVDGLAPEARCAQATHRFCSDACREQFLRDPACYVVRTHTV